MSTVVYPDNFLEDMPVLDDVDDTTIICVASGPDYLSYQLAVSILFTSPEFTGEPTAPTPDLADSSTRVATTEFVQGLLGGFTGGSGGGGTSAGATGDLQWNNGGVFAGGGPTWDGSSFFSVPGTAYINGKVTINVSGSSFSDYAIQAGTFGVQYSGVAYSFISDNLYNDGNGFKYKKNGSGVGIQFFGNTIGFQIAPSNSLGAGAPATVTSTFYCDSTSANFNVAINPPILADAAAPNGTVYLGSDHLDPRFTPMLCRRDRNGYVNVVDGGPAGMTGDLQFNNNGQMSGGGPFWLSSNLSVPGTMSSYGKITAFTNPIVDDYSFQSGVVGLQVFSSASFWFSGNLYNDGTGYKYKANGTGAGLFFSGTGVAFNTAPSNSLGAGASAMLTTLFYCDSTSAIFNVPIQPKSMVDSAAPTNSMYFGSDHLDQNSYPNLCRKDGNGYVTTLGGHPNLRVTSNSGPFDLSQADWFFRTLDGTNNLLSVTNNQTATAFNLELLQDGIGGHSVNFTLLNVIWMTSGGVVPPIALGSGLRTTFLFRQMTPGNFLGWLTGSQA